MKMLCFGDSNTYGYDPRSYFGDRYDAECRWVDLLAQKLNCQTINEGQNGREIPSSSISIPDKIDLMLIMLGSNDLLQGRSVQVVVKRMEYFLECIDFEKQKILLIGPPPMQRGEWVPTQMLIEASKELNHAYKALAERLSVRFADAGEWNIPLAFDGVHFTEEGHRAFAERLTNLLSEKGE